MLTPSLNPALQTRLRTALHVWEQESASVWWLFLHRFCQGFGEALFLAVADALFLSRFSHAEHPAEKLALAFVVAAGVLLVTGRVYGWLEHRLPPRRLMPAVVLALSALALLARAGLAAAPDSAMLAIGLVVAHRVIYQLTNLEFWGVSALLLDVRQGKRLFGLLNAGDMPAKLLGYLLVAVVAALGHTSWLSNLLVVAAASFLASLWVLRRLLAQPALAAAAHHTDQRHRARTTNGVPPRAGALARLFGSSFIAVLAGLSFLVVMAFTGMEFTFLEGAQQVFGVHTTHLAFFLGCFMAVGTLLTFALKFFSVRLVEEWGVRRTLLLPPLTLLVLALITAVAGIWSGAVPLFWLLSVLWLAAEMLKYALHDPVFLALFQPLSRQLRLHGHTRVKGLVDPLALAAAGVLLWLLLQAHHGEIPTDLVMRGLCAVLVGWAGVVLLVSRHYLRTLSQAIGRRFLDGGQVVIRDHATLGVLQEKLQSRHPEEVIYALELLVSNAPADLPATLVKLLQHPVDEVRCRVLARMDTATLRTARVEVLDMTAATQSPRVRAAAVRALSRLLATGEGEAPALLPFLEEPDPTVRGAAITALLRSGGLEAVVLAGQQLLRLVEATNPADHVLAARVIGELQVRAFYQPLQGFLQEANPAVRRAALEAAGLLANERLLPLVLDCLADRKLAEEATHALTHFGEPALIALAERLSSAPTPAAARPYVEVIGRLNGPNAEAQLLSLLTPPTDRRLREAAVRALRRMGYHAPTRSPAREALLLLLDQQLAHAAWCLQAEQELIQEAVQASSAALDAVWEALVEEGRSARERLFRILDLLCEPKAARKVRAGLESPQREHVANALEMLAHLLPTRQAAPLALLLEQLEPTEKLRLLEQHLPAATPLTPPLVLERLLRAGSNEFHRWTLATALRALPTPVPELLTHLLATYATSPDRLLRQAATTPVRYATLRVLTPVPFESEETAEPLPDFPMHSPNHDLEADSPLRAGELLEIEKVLVLKGTSVFAETPEHILVDIAAIVHEERVKKGQAIFKQGDLGDSMYVIYQGQVRIHSAETTFATFDNRDVFGELALLDPEPRSATATALTDGLLLRLDQEAFYELMAERREVAQGILRMLVRRLRAQNHLLAQRS